MVTGKHGHLVMLGLGEPCWYAAVDTAAGYNFKIDRALVHPADFVRYQADIPQNCVAARTMAGHPVAQIWGISVFSDPTGTAQQGYVLFKGAGAVSAPFKGRFSHALHGVRQYRQWKFQTRQQYDGVLAAIQQHSGNTLTGTPLQVPQPVPGAPIGDDEDTPNMEELLLDWDSQLPCTATPDPHAPPPDPRTPEEIEHDKQANFFFPPGKNSWYKI